MKKIRDVLRLIEGAGLSERKTEASPGISRAAITDCLCPAKNAGLSWPLPDGLNDAELEKLVFPQITSQVTVCKLEPNWSELHQALKQKGATLQVLHAEYMEQYQCCSLYRSW